jgi:alkyl hydroperoxide reductase subunit AhpC
MLCMTELGELERHSADFARRNTRVVAVSVEGPEDARKTQIDFPHLIMVADAGKGLSSVADAIHTGSAPDGTDTAAPATLLVDRQGMVRWQFRPSRFITRLSPDELLAAVDQHLPAGR